MERNMRPELMKIIKINERDNVVVALKDLSKNETVEINGYGIVVLEDVKQGHKIAIQDIQAGAEVIKYGFPIGKATSFIQSGSLVHVHNIRTNLSDIISYKYQPDFDEQSASTATPEKTFMGYVRADGSVGIRNEVWIVPTVGCVNSIALKLAERLKDYARGKVDDIAAFTHPYGCSQMGEDQENTKKILSQVCMHPNAGSILLLGLGCENCRIDTFSDYLRDALPGKIAYLECQSSYDEYEEGEKALKDLIDEAAKAKRQRVPVSRLVVGLKCGGSDGFSGITANHLLGVFSDRLTAMGGTTILTEVPEMFGAETILMNRCKDVKTFEKMVELINRHKEYYIKHDQVIYDNPSPGNKDGGLSTLEEKSLGCVQKGGTSKVVDVLAYGDSVKLNGLNVLSGPGNDLVASTVLAAAGAHIVLFTTGRGTPFGTFVPTVKISSNTELYRKKKNWIDFNAGRLLEDINLEDLADEFMDFVIEIASGEKAKNEIMGHKEIAIYKSGVTL
ncbi:MAG: UxaA family hydrolase [Anaerovoracaceae bacterium]|jgi:altronate hydrolase